MHARPAALLVALARRPPAVVRPSDHARPLGTRARVRPRGARSAAIKASDCVNATAGATGNVTCGYILAVGEQTHPCSWARVVGSRGRYRIILVRMMAGVRRQVWSPDTRRTRCRPRQEGHHQESAAA